MARRFRDRLGQYPPAICALLQHHLPRGPDRPGRADRRRLALADAQGGAVPQHASGDGTGHCAAALAGGYRAGAIHPHRRSERMTSYPSLHMIIDGERVAAGDRRTFTVRNPATGDSLGELPLADAADLDRALDAARRGFAIWRDSTPQQRAAVLQGAARLLAERAEDLARVATMEQGKPTAETRAEVMMCVGLFNFYAGECFRLYGRTLVRPAGTRSTVTKEPG